MLIFFNKKKQSYTIPEPISMMTLFCYITLQVLNQHPHSKVQVLIY